MKVLFLYFVPRGNSVRFHNGLGILSAILKDAGHSVSLLVLDRLDERKIDSAFDDVDLVACSVTSDQFDVCKEVVDFISGRVPIVIGGVHATVAPDECIALDVLGVCRGEGDYALLDLVNSLESGSVDYSIKNFWFNTPSGIVKNGLRPLITDLDKLPWPDRSIFDYQSVVNDTDRAVFMAGRGCPFQCTYCINHVLISMYKGKGSYIRHRSVENVIAEIKLVLSSYSGIGHVHFHDDTFTLNKEWLLDFCARYAVEVGVPFVCNVRANMIDQEKVDALKKAGCMKVGIGVESGNDKIRNGLLKRGLSNSQIVDAFRMFASVGIEVYSFNMIGLPYEDASAIEDTIRLNRQLKTRFIQVSMFKPYRGTKLWDLCKAKGLFSSRKGDSYFDGVSTLDLPSIDKDVLEMYYATFTVAVKFPKLWLFARGLHYVGLLDSWFKFYSWGRRTGSGLVGAQLRNCLKKFLP